MSAVQQAVASFTTASAGFTYTTWNPADKSTSCSVGAGDLVATGLGFGQGCRSILSKSSGKWYWEYTVNNAAGNTTLGIGLSTSTLTSQLGSANSGAGYWRTGDILYNFANQGVFSTYVVGVVLGIALDMTANTVSFYRNNVLQLTVSGIAAGSWFAQCYLDLGDQVTANFGATALTYTPPVGFNAGLYV